MTPTTTLDATENLFIRACKSDNSFVKIRRVAKKMYLFDTGEKHGLYSWVAMIGADIINDHFPIKLNEFLRHIQQCSANLEIRFYPDRFKDWSFDQMQNYVHAHAVVGYLALRNREQLKKVGYRSHLYFRLPEDKRASYEERSEAERRLFEWREMEKNLQKCRDLADKALDN